MLILQSVNAAEGDTLRIRVHDDVDMVWYGNYSEWGYFPSGEDTYRKIIMKYTMGCASGGCSDWDYTTRIFLRHRTGDFDTVQAEHPDFLLDGEPVEILHYCESATFITIFNNETQTTDTVWNPEMELVFYELDGNNITESLTQIVYPAEYWNYYYDIEGEIIDSIFIEGCETIVSEMHQYEIYNQVIHRFELARKITPYGAYMRNGSHGFSPNWTFTSYFDVTDFAKLLRDSVEIVAFYDGWSSGFSVSLDFEFIKGTPPREVIRFENLWSGGFTYNNAENFNNNILAAKDVYFAEDEKYARIRMTPSGHGFDNNVYCAEFCPKSYFVFVNDDLKYEQLMWNDKCGLNPIYPQGGTWLYDRANWCPGLRTETYLHEITDFYNPGEIASINIDLESYTWTGTQAPYYYIEAQLVTYGEANFQNDAEILDIIAPSGRDEFARINPICDFPIIVIRNSGNNALNSLKIHYGLKDGDLSVYDWTGNLLFMETDTVVLGSIDWSIGSIEKFMAVLSAPNGQIDENPDNDIMISDVVLPDVLNHDKIIIFLRTNSQGWQNAYYIEDFQGNIIFERDDLSNNTQYRDTVELERGMCYTFRVIDRAGNGLGFWANNEGSGQVSLRNANNGVIIKNFITDFGTELNYKFTTHYALSVENTNSSPFMAEIFPNPVRDELQISFNDNIDNLNIEIYSIDGKLQYQRHYSAWQTYSINIDVSELNNGLYLIKISNRSENIFTRFIKL